MLEAEQAAGMIARLDVRLAEIRAAVPTVAAAVLATRSGLILAAHVDETTDPDGLAALGADLMISVEAAARGLAGGEPREVIVRGPEAHVIALGAGNNAVLVALTDALTPASSVLPDLREAARELGEALAE